MTAATAPPLDALTPLAAALRYARRGWLVFPCEGKLPDGRLAPQGFQNSSTSDITVRAWWAANPKANIGVACGKQSGLFVVDVDPGKNGADTLAALEERHGPLPETPRARTGSGGLHVFFAYPKTGQLGNSAGRLGPGVDTRGQGGYVVVAPSLHPATGQPYEWLDGLGPADVELAPPPDWLVELLTDRPQPRLAAPAQRIVHRDGTDAYARRAFDDELDQLARTPEGSRNHQLNSAAFSLGQLVGAGLLDEGQVVSALEQTGRHIGLTDHEIGRTIDSGLTAGKAEPREIPEPSASVRISRAAPGGSPEAVGDLLDAVPLFPLEALPLPFRRLVEEVAAAMPCPPDFPATPLLVAAGAAIGDALELRLKDGWREGPNLYGAIVGDPGSKKTPAQELAVRALHRIQGKYDRAYAEELAEFERESALWDDAKKGERGAKPTPPGYHHVLTTDSTTEALAPMLLASKGILLVKDELAGWIRSMDAYRAGGKGADRQHYLSMWSRSPIKVDRKSRPAPIYVPRPVLAVVGGIQPDLLGDLADAAGREDGFVDRLLFSYPDPVPDRWTDASVKQATEIAVLKIFEALHDLKPTEGPHGEHQPWTIRLSVGAAAMWSEWYAAHAAEMGAESFTKSLRGPWAKMPGQLARLALILHAVDAAATNEEPDDELTETTLAAAADLVDYYKAHAKRAHRRIHRAKGGRDLALVILAALRDGGPMAQEAIRSRLFQRNVDADQIRAAVETLEEAGLAAREKVQGDTGRPATVWKAL